MARKTFPLAEILAVAKIHPFYNPSVVYPPDQEKIQSAVQSADTQSLEALRATFESLPLVSKKNLYHVIERLTKDLSPQNEYRRSSYVSITGGGSGGLPLMFISDTRENRQQRAVFGEFLSTCGVIEPHDWILTTHASGYLYRSLDLMSEIMENAGGTVFSAGNFMTPDEVVRAIAHYNINVLTGDGSQVIQVIHYISTLPEEKRKAIKLTKVIYTSEPLTDGQKKHIVATLGPVKICSILGSAEAGPYSIHNPDLTGEAGLAGYTDFVFDTRHILNEILPSSVMESDSPTALKPLPEGQEGVLVQTSLQRRRNPLVRYITGDVASIHPLPETARSVVPESELKHFRILRLRGRDRRFSFKWYGVYFEFHNIEKLMQRDGFGVLQWQVIIGTHESSPQTVLEVRLLRKEASQCSISLEDFVYELETFFFVLPENRHLFKLTFVEDLNAKIHEIPQPAEKLEVEDGPQDEDNAEYPSGFKLIVILVAIFLSLILTGLDFNMIATAMPTITTHFQTIADAGCIIARSFPLRKRPIFTGLAAAFEGISSAVAPMLGGVLTQYLSWRWCFYINLPLGGLSFILILLFFRDPVKSDLTSLPWKEKLRRLDLLGAGLFVPAITFLLLALQWGGTTYRWNDKRIIILFVLSGVFLAAFVWQEKRKGDNALLPGRVMRSRSVLAGMWFGLCNNTSFPIAAGLLTTIRTNQSLASLICYQALLGVGTGIGYQGPQVAVQTVLPVADASTGIALIIFAQNVGPAIFVAIAQTVFTGELLARLGGILPNMDTQSLTSMGFSDIERHVDPGNMPRVIEGYNKALTTAFFLSVGLACATVVGALGMEWRSVKK
ncbi:uncharacterized protein KD926_004703 [Aspergillus affinis]|uniref:uncharacterized protein n=1 Tax=Aspergillus affinis TaxID=1070780 RepID=UPI0022FF29F1|nr:uncharacterized protein KD926_004703 [Aspergillus affinis]KAI9035029.1 hypothetical protein KD926_004703 [Aspergillus affinis]